MSGISTIAGAEMQKKSSRRATRKQNRAAELALQELNTGYSVGLNMVAPWTEAGDAALQDYTQKVAEGPGRFDPMSDPGFEFGYKEFVEKPRLKAAAKSGELGDPRTQQALSRDAQGYASTKYDNFLNRWYQSLQSLKGIVDMGERKNTEAINLRVNKGLGAAGAQQGIGDINASGLLRRAAIEGAGAKAQGESNWKFVDTMMSMYGGGGMGGMGGG